MQTMSAEWSTCRASRSDAAGTALSRNATTMASITALPPELLEAILALIPVLPRLRAASLVCKRWRNVALRTVKELPYECSLGTLEHFPFASLTKLDLRALNDDTRSLQCPTSLQHLVLPAGHLTKWHISRLRDVPKLVSIDIVLWGDNFNPDTAKVMTDSRDTLQSITLWGKRARVNSFPFDDHFPALSALTLDVGVLPLIMCTRHASQLTRLALGKPAEMRE